MSTVRSWIALSAAAAALLGGCADGEVDSAAERPTPVSTPTSGTTASGAPTASPTAAPGAAGLEIRTVLTSSATPGVAAPPDLAQQYDAADCPLASAGGGADEPLVACDADGLKYLLDAAEIVGGVASASAQIPQDSASWVVLLTLDDEASAVFADLTQRLVGTEQQLAIVLDGEVLTAPTVQGPIVDGQVQIAGDFDEQSASDLAERLQG